MPARAWRPAVVARLARTLGSAVAAVPFIVGFRAMPSLICHNLLVGPESHACTFASRPTEVAWQASSGSAERVAAAAHESVVVQVVSSTRSGWASTKHCRYKRQACLGRSPRHVFIAASPGFSPGVRPAPCRSINALPNPSLKPSPNSKTPGPRCSACHHLQRGPRVFLSVPA